VLNRIQSLRPAGAGPPLSLLLTSVLFGIAHGESQGIGGMIQEGFAGLMLGVLYFAFGRKLAIPILAHGASNSLALVLIYFNRYPGL
jgi:membrane protease YdiL (CAAX protease family)